MSENIEPKRGPGRPPKTTVELNMPATAAERIVAQAEPAISRVYFRDVVSYGNGSFDSSGFMVGRDGSVELHRLGVLLDITRAGFKVLVPYGNVRSIFYAKAP